MEKTKEEIDKSLEKAWEEERAGNRAEATRIYSEALEDILVFRDKSPKEDYDALTRLNFIYTVIYNLIKFVN